MATARRLNDPDSPLQIIISPRHPRGSADTNLNGRGDALESIEPFSYLIEHGEMDQGVFSNA